jgi:predicted nuclease of predicted toxin-antitoxin system
MNKFLVDAQLPRRLARMMQSQGLDVVHTLDLPQQNKTKDNAINSLSLDEQRIVITKDEDFVQSFTLQGRPYKLLLVSTGNISNRDLENLFVKRLSELTTLFETCNFIEISREFIIVHGDG